MKTKTNVALSIATVAAVIVLFASDPLIATHQAQAGWGWHRHWGWGWHHHGWHHGGRW
ncbi:MAG TPA: hypothetical protein VEL11_18510 [Candidatus Bathyarchaeia archaeon]|nr:hypothetical protein [Candidatus Bathyarchaeia archaeon]